MSMPSVPFGSQRTITDAELAARARTGGADALGELYARYGDRVMAVAYRITGSAQDAEDVLHDVFLGLPEALGRYEERGALGAWLRQLAARVALTRLRAPSRKREVELSQMIDRASGNAPDADAIGDRVALAAALDHLPESLRVVFVLKAVEGHSHAEIADMLRISTGASEVRLVRATKMLRQLLGEPR